jgi:hypothetical protein
MRRHSRQQQPNKCMLTLVKAHQNTDVVVVMSHLNAERYAR